MVQAFCRITTQSISAMRSLNAYLLPKQTVMLLFPGLFVHTPFSVQAQRYGEWELVAEFDRMMWDITCGLP